MAALEPGTIAPPFRLEDLEGKVHSLEELRQGDLLLLVFYHSECPTCGLSMPFIGNLARAVRSERMKIWGVSQDARKETIKFAGIKGLEMPIHIDAEPYPVSEAYGLTNVPSLFLIDSTHTVIDQCVGFTKDDFVRLAQAAARNANAPVPDIFAGQEVPSMAYG
ncbi:MAG TPA: TlpA disulfide reductase family protein [Candidatus Binataceae bacterium]|jgi:peroxiredoxin|nr:TlpA disulfide reductase family protein [Candidatus Binataceae bacterium]